MSGLWQAIDSVVAARAWPRPPRRCRSSSCSTWPPPRCCWPPAPPGPSRSRPDLGHLPVIGAIAAAVIALAVLARRRLASPLRRLWAAAQQGGAILRTPGRYLRRVAALQAGAWACRIAVIYLLMAGFGLPASVPGAAVVMALCGASTLVPLTPGGAGTQQVMVAFALSEAARRPPSCRSRSACRPASPPSTPCSAVLAAMVAFRTLRPLSAVRQGLRLARA